MRALAVKVMNAVHVNYLFSEHYTFTSNWVYPEALIPYTMIRFIKRGRGEFMVNGARLEVEPGQIIYIPKGCKLSCKALTDTFEFISIRFTIEIPVEEESVWFNLFGLRRVTTDVDPIVEELFDKLVEERTSQYIGKVLRLRGYLEILLSYLLDKNADAVYSVAIEDPLEQERRLLEERSHQSVVKPSDSTTGKEIKSDSRISAVLEYVIRHMHEPLEVQRLGEMFQMSESTLRRLFVRSTGKPPIEFIRELKMQTAARMLLQTEERISDIADSVGFDDPNYFCRMFHKNYGVSPRDFRRISRG
ncbi:MAG: hypothetical protein CVV52_08490 [Spirochaetae bacterium HGW-Spirochaetae-8]|jgi:AraC-like DNA-binding protein|nr:MAG: hypothetical protein CVV52_08490 [Spirochaetae bacterium HGW-Spirochaetae-8]